MNTKWSFILIGCLMGTLLLGQNQNPNVNPRLQAMEQADNSPIDFWGKVVNQNGTPIAGATAEITVSSMLIDPDNRPELKVLSDANGLFSLTGKKGIGIVVSVTMDGYYSDEVQSAAALNYFSKPATIRFPSEEQGKPNPSPLKLSRPFSC